MLRVLVVSESLFVQSALQTHIKTYSLTESLKGKQRETRILLYPFCPEEPGGLAERLSELPKSMKRV